MTEEALKEGRILLIDKPLQWTSFQVVNKIKWDIKRATGIKKFKIGHAGTLDPLATGLLLVCVGPATKQIEQLQQGEKVYSGTMILGATTPCFDLEQAVDNRYPFQHITPQLIEEVRQQFEGDILQVPPMFSAVKVDGQRAYSYARDGEPVAIEPKPIHIYEFSITAFRNGNPDAEPIAAEFPTAPNETEPANTAPKKEFYRNPQGVVPPELPQIDFRIRCSKGTYIRSIARDFGLALNSGAFLSALRREQIGEFRVENALPPDQVVPE